MRGRGWRRGLAGDPGKGTAMRSAALAVLLLTLSTHGTAARESLQPGFWKGQFEIFQFNFSYAVESGDKGLVSRTVDLWRYRYDLYQNPAGIAREELASMNRNRSVEGPLDVRLLDYPRNHGTLFDKGRARAIAGPLTRGPGTALGMRTILGFDCRGVQYEWTTVQGGTVRLQIWSANSASLRVPLLETEYFVDHTGDLLSLTVQVISRVEPAGPLPASLFTLPRGLNVAQVPSVR